MPRTAYRLFFAIAAVAFIGAVKAGESASAQPYEKIRYPTFVDGRINSLLEADQAEAFDLSAGTPRINLRNVIITLFDHSEEALANTPEDAKLPVKMTITSDRGYFTRRPPEAGAPPEEIANLEGNVILRRFRTSDSPPPPTGNRRLRLDPAIETEVHCQHAQWNNTLRKLNGDGEVEFLQEDSRIIGTGFLYLADDDAMNEGAGGGSSIKDWGGIIFIEHNARMEIERDLDGSGAHGRTVITCKDTASYKLREREIQFEREVKIRRPGLTIESDILKVYLRREDDPQTDTSGNAPIPGMVRSIIATIGKRPGSVVITGFEMTESGEGALQYVARGGRADFDYDQNRITLTDTRLERTPEVEFGSDRISDRTLEFIFSPRREGSAPGREEDTPLEELTARGGQGLVVMRPRPGAVGDAAVATEVSYKGSMRFAQTENLIRFRETIFLRRGELRIRAEMLDVRLKDRDTADASSVQAIIAETDVIIQTDNREARSQRAEYDFDEETGLDTLKLFGPPQHTPPHPWIRDDEGNQIIAPTIIMRRLQASGRNKARHLFTGMDGTIVCDFTTAPDRVTEKSKVISIKCENRMEYNEARRIAWFEGQVMATSDAPEDNYVLTSDKLEIYLVEIPDPNSPGQTSLRPRRIDANGNARLLQDTRICEANQIIRDFPSAQMNEGDIYLEGAPAANGQPAQMAVYREQTGMTVGSLFAAPRIKASAKGNLIQANGPGQLSMPDEIPGYRSEIDFVGAARYESFHDGLASEAKFRKAVVLRQPSQNLLINSEELDARFLQTNPDALGAAAGEVTIPLERIGQLRRAEARVGVKVEHGMARQGKRVATGDKGVVEFTDTGNVITLTVDRRLGERRWVMARDQDGMTLWSPHVEVRDQQGITRAAGPGELRIPGDSSSEGLNRTPTRIAYGERGMMVYNELALNIKVSDNVRILQPSPNGNWEMPSLDGRCDRLDIALVEPPTEDIGTSEDALSRVRRMDAVGAVLLRVYADPPPEQPDIDWLSRPGTTFFTRGDQAVYEVPEGKITMSSLPGRQPQLLLNMVDPDSPPRRQRMKADRFVLNTNTIPRRWYFEGQLDSSTLRPGEAFDFVD